MKVQAVSDLKIIYDRNIKCLTDSGFRLVDIESHINPYPRFRGTLQKCRQKDKKTIPKSLDEINITDEFALTNEHLPFLR